MKGFCFYACGGSRERIDTFHGSCRGVSGPRHVPTNVDRYLHHSCCHIALTIYVPFVWYSISAEGALPIAWFLHASFLVSEVPPRHLKNISFQQLLRWTDNEWKWEANVLCIFHRKLSGYAKSSIRHGALDAVPSAYGGTLGYFLCLQRLWKEKNPFFFRGIVLPQPLGE